MRPARNAVRSMPADIPFCADLDTEVPKYFGAAGLRLGCTLLYLPPGLASETRGFFLRSLAYP
jgi:hypothetical protein